MNILTKRAIRLAAFVEAVSCIGMIFQTEPYGFWDKLCESIGWSPFAVSDVLVFFFCIVHSPVAFVFSHLFGSVGFGVFNGRLVFTSPLGLVVLLLQFALWSYIFLGLLHLEKRVKLLILGHDARSD